jgi:hypothetical protein
MSKTPKFDAKIDALLASVVPGERKDPVTGEMWTLTPKCWNDSGTGVCHQGTTLRSRA